MKNNDKTGLILFSDDVELSIPPKKGKSHVLRIIRELLEFLPKSNKTDLANAVKVLSNVMKKKAIVFVLSDHIDDDYEITLRIPEKKHDVTGIREYDANEKEIPNLGMVQMEDRQTGETILVNTSSKSVRTQYYRFFREREDYFLNTFSKSGSGTISCRIDESYVKKLLSYFQRR